MQLFGKNGNKHAAKALVNSLQSEKVKSDIIVSTIEDGVVFIDANRTIQLFNPAAARISGWLAGEAVGLDYKSVLILSDQKGIPYAPDQHPFERVFLSKNTVHDNSATLVTRSNKTIEIDFSVSPVLNDDGEIEGAVGIFRDVSDQRREEKQRADFISTASHEMRTPVAAIEGYLALALNDRVSKIDGKARGFLEKAHESTQHLGQLFQDLLTSAKAEDGRLTSHPTAIEMAEFIEKLTDNLHFVAEKKGLATEFLFGTESNGYSDASRVIKPLYYCYVDPDRMREVITNLFDNAVKYTDAGKITLSLTGDDKVVQFRIHDTGPGIPPEDQPHLFQKFYRVDNSATRTVGGTGLGLFICRKIVELYDGRMWVESRLGEGSTFFINLPRLTPEKAAQIKAQEAANPAVLPIVTQTTV